MRVSSVKRYERFNIMYFLLFSYYIFLVVQTKTTYKFPQQVVAKLNVRFEAGTGSKPAGAAEDVGVVSECFIKVFAMEDIEAGEELFTSYGSNYW